jgi:glycerol uptake facilitator-like aquaporin
MHARKYASEFFATFTLSYLVSLSIAFPVALPYATPTVAALTIGLLVYLIGPYSGAHINPAITVAMLSLKKISSKDAVFYVVAQMFGALAARFLLLMMHQTLTIPFSNDLQVVVAEGIGAFFLALGVCTVTLKKVDGLLAGVMVGASLFIGILTAIPFSNAILNPAVAFALGSYGPMYILGPIVGAVCGVWFGHFLHHRHA